MAGAEIRTTVQVGQAAPDFSLPSEDGSQVRLSEFRGKNVVLYFYKGDFTEGCTDEACAFRDSFEDFTDAGAEVIGVSKDSIESHKSFKETHDLPFTLLSDPDRSARNLYSTTPEGEELPPRVTFVIDKQGIVRLIFSHKEKVHEHIEETLSLLKAID